MTIKPLPLHDDVNDACTILVSGQSSNALIHVDGSIHLASCTDDVCSHSRAVWHNM